MSSKIIVGLIIILLGLSVLFGVDIPIFQILFALLIIWLGVRILTGGGGWTVGSSQESTSRENRVKAVLVFSGMNRKLVSEGFEGGEIVAVFGGGDLDLSEAKAGNNNMKITVVTVFGSVKIIAPTSWRVETEGIGILGGYNNRTVGKETAKSVLRIDGVAIFGGVDILNPGQKQ